LGYSLGLVLVTGVLAFQVHGFDFYTLGKNCGVALLEKFGQIGKKRRSRSEILGVKINERFLKRAVHFG
jgi:hypothetical protein